METYEVYFTVQFFGGETRDHDGYDMPGVTVYACDEEDAEYKAEEILDRIRENPVVEKVCLLSVELI